MIRCIRSPSIYSSSTRSLSTPKFQTKICSIPTSIIPQRTFTTDGVWQKRGVAAEAVDVDKHDRELLKKLQEQSREGGNKTAPKEEPKGSYVSVDDFAAFKKEINQKIKGLEEELRKVKSGK